MSDTKVYEPEIRARLGTAVHWRLRCAAPKSSAEIDGNIGFCQRNQLHDWGRSFVLQLSKVATKRTKVASRYESFVGHSLTSYKSRSLRGYLTNAPDHLWRDKWTALSGPRLGSHPETTWATAFWPWLEPFFRRHYLPSSCSFLARQRSSKVLAVHGYLACDPRGVGVSYERGTPVPSREPYFRHITRCFFFVC